MALVGSMDPVTVRVKYQLRTELQRGPHPTFAKPLRLVVPSGHVIVLSLFHVFLKAEQPAAVAGGVRGACDSVLLGDTFLRPDEVLHDPLQRGEFTLDHADPAVTRVCMPRVLLRSIVLTLFICLPGTAGGGLPRHHSRGPRPLPPQPGAVPRQEPE